MNWTGALALLFLPSLSAAQPAVTLFDFETDAEIAAWTIRSAKQDALVRSPRFATSNSGSA